MRLIITTDYKPTAGYLLYYIRRQIIKNTFLFDLDGTITDPGEGITNSVAYALAKYGIINTDRTELYPFIGPPLNESFEKYAGLSREEGFRAVDYYREYYAPKGIYECHLYNGITDVLTALKASGARVAIATSKPEVFARQLMEHFGIADLFDFIAGSELNGGRIKKAEVIARAMSSLGATPEECVMIGDREHDIIGAKTHGITSVGVLFGYGSLKELTDAGADYTAATAAELKELLTGFLASSF